MPEALSFSAFFFNLAKDERADTRAAGAHLRVCLGVADDLGSERRQAVGIVDAVVEIDAPNSSIIGEDEADASEAVSRHTRQRHIERCPRRRLADGCKSTSARIEGRLRPLAILPAIVPGHPPLPELVGRLLGARVSWRAVVTRGVVRPVLDIAIALGLRTVRRRVDAFVRRLIATLGMWRHVDGRAFCSCTTLDLSAGHMYVRNKAPALRR